MILKRSKQNKAMQVISDPWAFHHSDPLHDTPIYPRLCLNAAWDLYIDSQINTWSENRNKNLKWLLERFLLLRARTAVAGREWSQTWHAEIHAERLSSGVEADQKVIAAHGCYASTVITALTAQNTQGVHGIHHTPPHFVNELLDAVLSDIDVDVVKTGIFRLSEVACSEGS